MIKGRIYSFILLIACLLASSTVGGQSNSLDLSAWDGQGYVTIDKNWTFVPNEFVFTNSASNTSGKIQMGTSWNEFKTDDGDFGAIGKGTYLKTIFLPDKDASYEFDMGTISSAYALYINNKLVRTVGDPYTEKGKKAERYNTEIVDYYANSYKIDIVLHVVNWRYSKGGAWSPVYLSKGDYAKEKRSKRISLLFVLFGGILVMSFYHGGLYLLRGKEVSSLFFFLWTLAASLRLLFSGRYYPIYDLIDIDWYWTIKFEYLTFYLAIPLFMQFLYEIFPKSINKKFVRVFIIIGLAFTASIFFIGVNIMTKTVMIYQVYTFVGILYMLFVVFTIVRKKESGLHIFIIGFLVLTIAVIHDILVSNQIVHRTYWFPIGLLTFVFLQAYLLASRFTATFSRAEVLSKQLNYMNLHLEKIVDERTERLKSTNELLKFKNEEVSKQSDQLELMNKELKKLSVVASETDNGIIITDSKGEIEWVNKGFEKMYGFSLGELHKKYGHNLKNAGRSEHMDSLFERVKNEKKSVSYEAEVYAKGGESVQVQTTLTPILDGNGNIIYMVAIDTDISKIKQVQGELSKTISAKNKLFSIIAHDLRNPFNSLLGLTELIIQEYNDLTADELLRFIKDLNSVSKSTYSLLLNLLDWSRSQRGMIELKPEKYNLRELISGAMESFEGMLEEKQLKFVSKVPENYTVFVDKHTIETVFRNLISNAIKFSPKGKNIYFNAEQVGEYIKLNVVDEGVGIPEENQQTLFTIEGNSTSGTEQEKGTGLGLMLCKDFVDKNGGEISVTSKLNHGTTFTIKLPVNNS